MDYTYYPGCSQEVSNKAYDVSARNATKALGIGLTELEDWNCCGATNYMSVRELRSFAVSARNLALAEKALAGKPASNGNGRDLVTVCSACYTTLNKTNRYFEEDAKLRARIQDALSAAGLSYSGSVKVRHLLDVIVNDVGIENVVSKSKVRLDGLRVAPYYGCQLTRPYATFDDAEHPTTMDRLFSALGAEAVDYPVRAKCCGGMLMTTAQPVALKLAGSLLETAARNGADCIVTCCPLCQFNLDAYQGEVNRLLGAGLSMPVLFFTQLLGVALGLSRNDIMLGKEMVSAGKVLAPYMKS